MTNNKIAIPSNDPRDERLAKAQRELDWRRRLVREAEEELLFAQRQEERAHRRRDAVDPIARAQKLVGRALDTVNELVPPPDPDHLDLDADTRSAEQQAADFFNRAGDFHEVHMIIPCEGDEAEKGGFAGRKFGASAVIKFTPAEKPLAVEILRQLRGALNARITITRLEQPATEGRQAHIPGPPGPPDYTPDNGPAYQIGRDFTLGQRYSSEDMEREAIAEQQGVPVEWVRRAGSPTGDRAWTITPPTPEAAGRHAAITDVSKFGHISTVTDDEVRQAARQKEHEAARDKQVGQRAATDFIEKISSQLVLHLGPHDVIGTHETPDQVYVQCNCGAQFGAATEKLARGGHGAHRRQNEAPYNTDTIFRAHNERFAHSLFGTSTDVATDGHRLHTYTCACGQELDGDTEDEARALWDTHRREAFGAALLGEVHDATYNGDDE